jgi:hypothetical protein
MEQGISCLVKRRATIYFKSAFLIFKQIVIPLAETLDVPGEPPLTLPSPPEMQSLGTKSELAMNMKSRDENNLAELKAKTYTKRDRREADGV